MQTVVSMKDEGRQKANRYLAGWVDSISRCAHQAKQGRDINNSPTTLLLHVFQTSLSGIGWTVEINIHNLFHERWRSLASYYYNTSHGPPKSELHLLFQHCKWEHLEIRNQWIIRQTYFVAICCCCFINCCREWNFRGHVTRKGEKILILKIEFLGLT